MLQLLAGLGGVYAFLVAAMAVGYRRVLYPAPRRGESAPPLGASLLRARARDGVAVRAFAWTAPSGAATFVHFHGNGETIEDSAPVASRLHGLGFGVVLVEYRGYGASREGAPTEQGLYLDAEAVLDALGERGVDRSQIVLWGTSLGTGVAAEMAVRGRGCALVLVAPYTSIPLVAQHYVRVLPATLVIGDRFETIAKAPRITVEALVIHGSSDEVIPYRMGVDVAHALPHARLLTIEGGHHNDLWLQAAPTMLDAMASIARRSVVERRGAAAE